MIILYGILSSLIAGIMLIVGASFLSEKARWMMTAVLGQILDIDVERVFPDEQHAVSDIQKELARAKYVYFMRARGNELQRATFEGLFTSESKKRRRAFRVLLSVPHPQPPEYDWTAHRECELADFDKSFGRRGMLATQIETNIRFLMPHVHDGIVELRLVNSPQIGRVLVTDRAAYMSPYRSNAHGRDCRVIKYRSGGDTYECLHRLFNMLWDAGQVPEQPAVEAVEERANT